MNDIVSDEVFIPGMLHKRLVCWLRGHKWRPVPKPEFDHVFVGCERCTEVRRRVD